MGLLRPKQKLVVKDADFKRVTRAPDGTSTTREFHVHPDDPEHCWFCGGELKDGAGATLTSMPLDGTPVMAFCHPACFTSSKCSLRS